MVLGFCDFCDVRPRENRYFFTKKTWFSILTQIVSQTDVEAVIDQVKLQILQVV